MQTHVVGTMVVPKTETRKPGGGLHVEEVVVFLKQNCWHSFGVGVPSRQWDA